jgi:hypothetical protein
MYNFEVPPNLCKISSFTTLCIAACMNLFKHVIMFMTRSSPVPAWRACFNSYNCGREKFKLTSATKPCFLVAEGNGTPLEPRPKFWYFPIFDGGCQILMDSIWTRLQYTINDVFEKSKGIILQMQNDCLISKHQCFHMNMACTILLHGLLQCQIGPCVFSKRQHTILLS